VRDVTQLCSRVREQFPLAFGQREGVSLGEFHEAYNALAEKAIEAAAPSLLAETHKVQWALVAASLGLISLVLFKIGKIKIGDSVVDVDRQVFVWYAVFVIALLIAFAFRARLDLQRASLAQAKNQERNNRIRTLVVGVWNTRTLEQNGLFELFDQIGRRYTQYKRIHSKKSAEDFPEEAASPSLPLNMDAARKDPEIAAQISAQEEFIANLLDELDRDLQSFKAAVEALDAVPDKERDPLDEVIDPQALGRALARGRKLDELYDKLLEPWFSARSKLSSEFLGAAMDKRTERERLMLESQLNLMRKTLHIRRLYVWCEISPPVALALIVVFYVLANLPAQGSGSLHTPSSGASATLRHGTQAP
jgi:hypothetical protein